MAERPSPSIKPIMLITHSRSCSTVIERVFWTNPDIKCYHEHFGDAFYFGPERISDNWLHWPAERIQNSGKSHVTYKTALEDILEQERPQKYVLNKEMSYHILPPNNSRVTDIASLSDWQNGEGVVKMNPTWLPDPAFKCFRFAFLIRTPWLAIPSLYRLHIPPLVHETMEPYFKPAEIGYREMKILIQHLFPQFRDDELRNEKDQDGPKRTDNISEQRPILIDASDVLDQPERVLSRFCDLVGLPFDESMLSWDPNNPEMEKEFSKFPGFHTDAISSSGLRKKTNDEQERAKFRQRKVVNETNHHQDENGMEMSEDEYMSEWTDRYGEMAARKILDAVYLCKSDYAWLKRFAVKV